MVDVFDRHEVRFDPRLAGCSKFIRHSDYATLEEQLAKLAAENERLKQKLAYHQRATNTVVANETGNVSDKTSFEQELAGRSVELFQAQTTTDPEIAAALGRVDRADLYLTTPAPEGQQEPVVDNEPWGYWVKHKYAEGGLVRTPCFVPEESHYTEVLPLFTRPSEQAVTEAGEMAAEQVMAAHYERPLKAWELTALHEALTAAQEAGKP